MRVAFLTACLAEGRDGVGDYVLGLGRELAAGGAVVAAAAWAEPGAGAAGRRDRDPEAGFPILRLDTAAPAGDRRRMLESWLAEFRPDRTSVQLAPWGYHPRGLLDATAAAWSGLRVLAPVHLLVHEPWVGAEAGAAWKHRCLGALQRRGYRKLLAALRPASVHVTQPAYAALLGRVGVRAAVLPLFGNVPVTAPPDPPARARLRAELAGDVAGPGPLLVTFGTLHAGVDPEAVARAVGGPCAWVLVGRQPPAAETCWADWTARRPGGGALRLARRGAADAAVLSAWFHAADGGVAATPWALVGKSGAVAALREHGRPVLVARDDWRLRAGPTPPPEPDEGLVRLGPGVRFAPDGGTVGPVGSRRPAVAAAFRAALDVANPGGGVP